MIIIAGLLLGAIGGGLLAWRRKGSRLDIAQYAATFAIAWGIVGLLTTVIVDRLY